MINFVDTNILLHGDIEKIIEKHEHIYISSITLQEIENIKTSSRKDGAVKYNGRVATRFLKEHNDCYTCIPVTKKHYEVLEELGMPVDNDNLIMSSALKLQQEGEEVTFYTDDICCFNLASKVFGLNTLGSDFEDTDEDYKGFKEIIMTDVEMAKFYECDAKENTYNLVENEYLIIKDTLNQPVDAWKFNGVELVPLDVKSISSFMLGKLKAKDFYQQCVLDSFQHNQITMVRGRAGAGKSHLAMSYALSQLEKGKISKILMFINDVPVKDSELHGFLPGTLEEKILNSQIGAFLSGKLGDKANVMAMIQRGQLELLPMSDIRGLDVQGDILVYITECQNTTIQLLKLALQRIGEGVKVILDGDTKTQIDAKAFEGTNNGMRRASKILKGTELYGEIELKNIYRSKLAELVDKM